MRKEQRKDFYQKVIDLPGFESYDKEYDFRHDTFDWLKQFVLADCSTLASWVANCPKLLKFDYMKKVYINRFSMVSRNMLIGKKHIIRMLCLRR